MPKVEYKIFYSKNTNGKREYKTTYYDNEAEAITEFTLLKTDSDIMKLEYTETIEHELIEVTTADDPEPRYIRKE